MLHATAVGNAVPQAEFDAAVPTLREELIEAQYDLREADFPLIIIVGGDDRVGANDLVNRINEWLDSRFIRTHVWGDPLEEEAARPRSWRLWRAVPPKGQSALWVGGLFRMVLHHISGEVSAAEMERWARHLRTMQAELLADGAMLLKFFVHTPAAKQKKRLKRASKKKSWRYDERDFAVIEHLAEGIPMLEEALRETSVPGAPWTVIEGTDPNYRDLAVAQTILAALRHRLANPPAPAPSDAIEQYGPPRRVSVLDTVDLTAALDKAAYRKELAAEQAKLHRLADEARRRGVGTVLAFEGWDAGGKGGAIRRITGALEAGDYRVIPTAAPTAEELRYHYLWRFWRDLPRAGDFAIFDRTWYGRVLVERVEGFARPDEWQRAYGEILDFEEQIAERGFVVQKFWLHISPEEQLARFQAREQTGYKRHKITEEDYRNREKWPQYAEAVDDMVVRTSADFAPWHVIPANDKRYARVAVLRAVNEGLTKALRSL